MKTIVLRNGEVIEVMRLAEKLFNVIREMENREVLFLHFHVVDWFNIRQYVEAAKSLGYNKCIEVLDSFELMKSQMTKGNLQEAKLLVNIAVEISKTTSSRARSVSVDMFRIMAENEDC